jgi:hypothetical protein
MNYNLFTNMKANQKNHRIFTAFVMTFVVIATAFFMMMTGCKKKDTNNNTSNEPGQTTAFKLRMTDKPGNYDAVNIDVIGAEVHSDVSGWVTLKVVPGIYNLLELTNGKDTLIADGQVAVGTISQIRLILGNNNTVIVGGNTFPLTTPSAQQSGLKLQVHETLTAGVEYTMLIDFDADKSIVQTGNGKYMLKPVLRVITNAINGAIDGIVMPLLAKPSVYAIMGTDSFSTYADTLTGMFHIGGLAAGSYNVLVMPKAPYSDTTISGVGVTLGNVTNTGIIIVK